MSYLTHGRRRPRRSVVAGQALSAIVVVLAVPAAVVYGVYLLYGWLT